MVCSMTEQSKPCTKAKCNGTAYFARFCGAYVCDECEQHIGLARCYCGWSETAPGKGYLELIEMGETIEPEDEF